MLLVDEIERTGSVSEGKYTVRGDEFFLDGHFPGNPVVPGVILCEMMAQSACVLVEAEGSFTPFLTGLNNIRFKKPVKPGDIIDLHSEIVKQKSVFYFVKCSAHVNGELCASGELSFALIKEQ
jgi:3-hydroxyacyl-[acyl-carrier-protein] dehydratase